MDVVLLVTCGVVLLADAVWTLDNCVYYRDVAAGETVNVYSPNYPNKYPSGASCSWEAVAPSNSRLILQCNDFSLPTVSEMLGSVVTQVQCGRILREFEIMLYKNINKPLRYELSFK
jgi:hypothetical protein